MNKAKMKCAVCHKSFKSNKATQLLCDDCERKRRKEKADGAVAAKPTPKASAITTGGKPTWLANATVRDAAHPYAVESPVASRSSKPDHQPRQDATKPPASPKGQPSQRGEKPSRLAPPRAPRPARTPTPPYQPTETEIAAIEQRYRELAQPEFDGIRTQIAQELHIPKRVVREVVAALRKRDHLPSWWEIQSYQGTPEELERIKVAYSVHLPVPPVGIHRLLAKELGISSTTVYQGIGAVRQSLGLPAFNPPEVHPEMPQNGVAQAAVLQDTPVAESA